MLECVVNVSEGRQTNVLAKLVSAAGDHLLDVHHDGDHHRSVFTIGGPNDAVEDAVRTLAVAVVALIDLRVHVGAHPRIGALDVVPWISLEGWPVRDGPAAEAVAARDRFAEWCATNLRLPCFLYGPERSLPDLRREAWVGAEPDTGPHRPHRTAGAVACGARRLLVAYNLWLEEPNLAAARQVAAQLRGDAVRALGLAVGDHVQVSCNLVDPWRVGPAAVFDAVAGQVAVARAELVGLIPGGVLEAIEPGRWNELDLGRSRTIEARLEEVGLDGGRSSVRHR